MSTTAVRPPPGLRRRIDTVLLRWQARLDAEWADRVVPWVMATLLFIVFFLLAFARARSLRAGTDLGAYTQGAWLVRTGRDAELTLTGNHLLADQLPLVFYPLAFLTKVLPTTQTLLGAQAAALAAGVVPLWRIARRLADLRVGASTALVAAYGLSPAVNNLNLGDFHPAALALPALIAAVYFGLTNRWLPFGLAAGFAVLCRADLGLAVAGLGVLLAVSGKRREGLITTCAAGVWVLVAVLVIQPAFGESGLVSPAAFADYGGSFWGVAGRMISNPYRVVVDLLGRENLDVLITLLAPLLFLPMLAPRYLLPAVPLECLYLVADVPHTGAASVQYTVALTAFLFVAAAFALSRIGRRSVERVLVDRRILVALVLASLAFFGRYAENSPYAGPWHWGRQDSADEARLDAVDLVGDDRPVRASPTLLPLLAERERVYELAGDAPPTGGGPHEASRQSCWTSGPRTGPRRSSPSSGPTWRTRASSSYRGRSASPCSASRSPERRRSGETRPAPGRIILARTRSEPSAATIAAAAASRSSGLALRSALPKWRSLSALIGTTWTWACGTSIPAMISPTRRGSNAASTARPIRCATSNTWATRSAGMSTQWSISSIGTTSVCPGLSGSIVRNATHRSSRHTNRPGISPSMMRVKTEGMGHTVGSAAVAAMKVPKGRRPAGSWVPSTVAGAAPARAQPACERSEP